METYKLVSNKTGAEIKIGDQVQDFRGKTWTLKGFSPPRGASTGRVYLEAIDKSGLRYQTNFFPSVINAHIAEYRTGAQTFLITLRNGEQELDALTVSVTTAAELLQNVLMFISNIDEMRDGDTIHISTPPWII